MKKTLFIGFEVVYPAVQMYPVVYSGGSPGGWIKITLKMLMITLLNGSVEENHIVGSMRLVGGAGWFLGSTVFINKLSDAVFKYIFKI